VTATVHANRRRYTQNRRPGLAVFAAINAFAAWAGAVGLVSGAIGLGARLDDRLPFGSPVLGGVALAVVVALPLSVLAWRAWCGDPRSGRTAITAGALLVGWIVVQVAFLRELSWFHPTYVLIGVLFVLAGWRVEDRT
jgi:hypothetical protein